MLPALPCVPYSLCVCPLFTFPPKQTYKNTSTITITKQQQQQKPTMTPRIVCFLEILVSSTERNRWSLSFSLPVLGNKTQQFRGLTTLAPRRSVGIMVVQGHNRLSLSLQCIQLCSTLSSCLLESVLYHLQSIFINGELTVLCKGAPHSNLRSTCGNRPLVQAPIIPFSCIPILCNLVFLVWAGLRGSLLMNRI